MRSPQVIIPVSEGKGNRHGNPHPRSARRRHDRGCRSHRDRCRPPAPSPQQDHRVLAGRPGHASSDPSSVAHTDRSLGCERHLSGARITFDRTHLGPATLPQLALERLVAGGRRRNSGERPISGKASPSWKKPRHKHVARAGAAARQESIKLAGKRPDRPRPLARELAATQVALPHQMEATALLACAYSPGRPGRPRRQR
jgi:hypothetical protein